MRGTNLMYRNPKDQTPDPYNYRVIYLIPYNNFLIRF